MINNIKRIRQQTIYLFTTNQSAAFFRPESRFWELLIGVAFSRFENTFNNHDYKLKPYIGIVGLIFCLIGIIVFKGNGTFPGVRALLPTIGVLLIIASESNGLINRTIFSNAFIIFIGKISYSLYLWHWPFLSLTHLFYPDEVPFYVTLLAVGLAVVFSIITYYGVEKPLKHLDEKTKKIVSLFAFSGLILGFVCGRFIYKEKIKQAFVEKEVSALMEASTQWVDFSKISKDNQIYYTENEFGKFITRGKGPIKIAFIGDSHSEQYFPVVERFVELEDSHFTVYFLTWPGCSGLLDVKHRDTAKKGCHDFFENGYKFLEKEKVSKVIFSSFWGAFLRTKLMLLLSMMVKNMF